LDEDRPSLLLDCELRFERVEPRLERELLLFEPDFPDLPPEDLPPDFADPDAEVARAIWSLLGRVSVEGFRVAIPKPMAADALCLVPGPEVGTWPHRPPCASRTRRRAGLSFNVVIDLTSEHLQHQRRRVIAKRRSSGRPSRRRNLPSEGQEGDFMARAHSARWLSDQARVGLRELPTNAAWLLSRVQPGEVAGSAATQTRDTARKLKASLVDAAPVGDSVEARMQRASAAAERAQEAEREALEAVQSAKESAEQLQQLAESNRAWLADVEREANRRAEQRVAEAQRAAEQRVAEAQRAAEQQVEQERAAARSEADEKLEKARAEATEETEAARRDAEVAQQRADNLLRESRDRLAKARQLAKDAAEAAHTAAEEADRQAQRLAADAEQQANGADSKAAAAKQLRDDANRQTDDNLESQSKAELLDLAAALEIDGRTHMSKGELVSAITKAKAAPHRAVTVSPDPGGRE
jgi:colicin import membrane protein